jgi:hypothetical protein
VDFNCGNGLDRDIFYECVGDNIKRGGSGSGSGGGGGGGGGDDNDKGDIYNNEYICKQLLIKYPFVRWTPIMIFSHTPLSSGIRIVPFYLQTKKSIRFMVLNGIRRMLQRK